MEVDRRTAGNRLTRSRVGKLCANAILESYSVLTPPITTSSSHPNSQTHIENQERSEKMPAVRSGRT